MDSLVGIIAVRTAIENATTLGLQAVEFWGELSINDAKTPYVLLHEEAGSNRVIAQRGSSTAVPRVQVDAVAASLTEVSKLADSLVTLLEAAQIRVAIESGANSTVLRRARGTWRVNHDDLPTPFTAPPNTHRITLLFEWGEVRP